MMNKALAIEPELMTKSDVAKLIQVSARQVENLVKSGRLIAPIRLGSHPRWRRSQLLAFLDAMADTDATVTGQH